MVRCPASTLKKSPCFGDPPGSTLRSLHRTGKETSCHGWPPPHILIVDDDPALLEALPETVRLRIPGAVVESADSVAAALAGVVALDPDVIVTDLVMPGMTGLDLIAKLGELRPWMPMILMSGNPNPQGYALRTRAYAFIHKPIDRDYFIASLRRAIRYSRLSRRITGTTEQVKEHLAQLAELQRQANQRAATARSRSAGGQLPAAPQGATTTSHRS